MPRRGRQPTQDKKGMGTPGKQHTGSPKPAESPSGHFATAWWVVWGVYPVVMLCLLWFLAIRPITDPDCWFHMALGRYVMQHKQVPYTDMFSHTAQGREWISSGWAASVIMHLLFDKFGPAGLVGMVWAILVACWGGLYVVGVRRAGTAHVLGITLLLAALAGYLRFNPRPDIWSLFFTPLVIILLTVGDSGPHYPRRVMAAGIALPLTFALWSNLHAGFLAGLILVALAAASCWRAWLAYPLQARGVWLVGVAASFLTWMANPYGAHILALATKIRAIPGVRMLIFEWMPMVYLPGFDLPAAAYVGFAGLVSAWIIVTRLGRADPLETSRRFWHVGAGCFLIAFALWQRRQVGLCASGLPALMLPYLPAVEKRVRRWGGQLAAGAVCASLVICGLQVRGDLEAGEGLPVAALNARMLPCAAADFLKHFDAPEQLFNSYGFGGYFMYFLGPKLKVFIDGRLDVYSPQTWQDYLAAEENRLTLDEVCKRYGISTFAIDTREAFGDPVHLVNRLTLRPDWALVFYDDDSAVFVKRTAMREDQRALEIRYATPYDLQRFLSAVENPQTQHAALSELRRNLEFSNGCAFSYALAGWAALRTGERAAMEQYLRLALERDPKCPLAKQLLEHLQKI